MELTETAFNAEIPEDEGLGFQETQELPRKMLDLRT
jgi:hypothetical protein